MNKGIQYWLLITLLFAFAFTSCGALLKGSTQSVGIKSFQQGSTIEVDGQTHVSPALIELPRNQNYVVAISKEGYETQQLRITQKISGGIVALDILCGILPVIVDAVMGTWYNLSPKEINVNLVSKQTGALDIPVKMVLIDNASLKVVSPQRVHIRIEQSE